jgi:hypothetical protein
LHFAEEQEGRVGEPRSKSSVGELANMKTRGLKRFVQPNPTENQFLHRAAFVRGQLRMQQMIEQENADDETDDEEDYEEEERPKKKVKRNN